MPIGKKIFSIGDCSSITSRLLSLRSNIVIFLFQAMLRINVRPPNLILENIQPVKIFVLSVKLYTQDIKFLDFRK